jgi:general L-amino acid transport system permease protein
MFLMTTMTDPPKASFRLSMLLYDTRYRSTTIQVIALIGFMLGAAWLVNNVIVNLAASGKTFNYGFLNESSGYDINQRLLDYSSQSSHLRASVIGLLNTLLVAVMGCALATVIGVLVGILRLSKNWIVSRLAAVYVETLRNVPVLLWIILLMAAISHSLPAPRDFRGEEPAASMYLFDSIAITNRGVYVPEPLFSNGLGDFPVFPDAESASCKVYFETGGFEAYRKVDDSCGTFQISLDLIAIMSVFLAGIFISSLMGNAPIKSRQQRVCVRQSGGNALRLLWFRPLP